MTVSTVVSALILAGEGGGSQASGNPMGTMLVIVVGFFAIVYFMSIRPQRRQQKEHQEMISKLKAGDKVITIGGICGEVFQVKDDSFIIKVDEKSKMEVTKGGIRSVVTGKSENGDGKKDDQQG